MVFPSFPPEADQPQADVRQPNFTQAGIVNQLQIKTGLNLEVIGNCEVKKGAQPCAPTEKKGCRLAAF